MKVIHDCQIVTVKRYLQGSENVLFFWPNKKGSEYVSLGLVPQYFHDPIWLDYRLELFSPLNLHCSFFINTFFLSTNNFFSMLSLLYIYSISISELYKTVYTWGPSTLVNELLMETLCRHKYTLLLAEVNHGKGQYVD